MKKIILLLLIFSIFFTFLQQVNAIGNDCVFPDGAPVDNALDSCLLDVDKLVQPLNLSNNSAELRIQDGFKEIVLEWVTQISIFLSLVAVGSIVYGGLMMTISAGEDEKIKKAKDIVKWSMLGFISIITAGGLITILINLVYTIAG